MKEMLKEKQKGITLIALVITIIVLLILAGVSIAMLAGENGILTKASKAKEDMEYGRAYEEVKLAVTAVEMEYKADDKPFSNTEECASDLDEELKRTSNADDAAVNIEDGILIATNRGYKFPINEFLSESTIVVVDGTGLWEQENGVLVAYKGEISELDGGTLVIPNYVDGVKVTEIGERLFAGKIQQPLQVNLKISEGITRINTNAFASCDGLVGELKLPQSLSIIGEGAFVVCKFTGDLIIPDNVITIGKSAFTACAGFTGDLIIPESVTTIGDSAFVSCYGITLVRIPESVTSIGSGAFFIGKSGVRKCIYVDGFDYRPDGWDYDWVNYYYNTKFMSSSSFPYIWKNSFGTLYEYYDVYYYEPHYDNDKWYNVERNQIAVIWNKSNPNRLWYQPQYINGEWK